MNFENQFPEWKNEGVEPDTSLKNEGFKGGYKPPAGIFNWFWSKVMKSTKEIQDKVSEIDEDKLSIISKSNSEWNQDNEPIPEGVLAYNTTERRAMIGDGNTQMTSYLNNIGQNIGPNTIAGEYGTCYGIGNSTDSSSNHTHIKGSLNRSTNSKFSNLRGASLSVTNSFNSQLMGERNAVDSSNYSSVFGLKSEANASGYALLNGVSNNAASSPYSFLNGNGHIATNSSYSILGGIGNKASNSGYAFMFGKNNTTDAENAEMAVTFGEKNVNNSTASFIAGGQRNTILNNGSTETGQAISYCSTILGGQNNVIFGKCGLAGGYNSWAGDYQTVLGLNARVNKNFANASDNTGVPVIRSKYGTVFKIGGGTGSYQSTANGYVDEDGNPVTLSDSPGFRENLLRLAYGSTNNGGDLYVGKTVTSGADYAEIYEWEDTNSNGEDRRGLFVTLNGTKIKKAKGTDEYVLGIISSDPAVIGDCPDGWHNMYLKDVFGKILYYDDVDEEGNVTSKPLINPDYDPSQHYISRDQRIEKDAVGTHGKLVVVDDGTCVVNGYCWPGTNGIGTNDTVHKAYRVMERLDDTHVRVVLK